jgi:hypothetical protein
MSSVRSYLHGSEAIMWYYRQARFLNSCETAIETLLDFCYIQSQGATAMWSELEMTVSAIEIPPGFP